MNNIFKEIYKVIKKYDKIVIARHIGPDPDAIGSQIALRDSIKLTFPNKNVYAIGAGVSRFKYLGSLDKIDVTTLEDSLLIVLDVPNFIRVDGIEDLKYSKIIKIDHHPKEDIVGDVDFTSNNYSSTAEMIAELILNSKLMMDTNVAESLFMGIVSDSERFLFRNTTVHTFEIVIRLLKDYQIDFLSLYDKLYEKGFNECKFEAYITDNMTITENGLGYLIIDNNEIEKLGLDSSAASVAINKFNFIRELYCWCFVTYDERNEIYKVNIRSRGPVVNEVAANYHGGGHAYASGARISKKDDIDKLINDLDKLCSDYLGKENE